MNKDNAASQAKAQLDSIIEMVTALDTEDDDARDEARERILEDALSVEVRSDWEVPGATFTASEYRVLLCTGGPAVQIVGNLSEHGEPETARLMYQDWFTPWSELIVTGSDRAALMSYVQQFYFGE